MLIAHYANPHTADVGERSAATLHQAPRSSVLIVASSLALQWSQPGLDPVALRLQEWRQRQTFPQMCRVFIGRETGTVG